jgi:hypothetical protein
MTAAIKAFITAQAAMEPARKATNNPHFSRKYADLSTVQEAVFPALHANGFGVQYLSGFDERGEYVDTVFLHESGERFSTRVRLIVGRNDMQGYGSAKTYARRYGLMDLAGIAPEDDDGNAAAKAAPKRPPIEARREAFRDSLEPPHDPETGEVAEPQNPAQAASQGLRDAWVDGIRDSLPEFASPVEFQNAVADALIAAFAAKKSERGCAAQWHKREDLIMEMRVASPPAYHRVLDAFNKRMAELREPIVMGEVRVS